MINVRIVQLSDVDRLLEIYDYYVKNTAITFEYDTPSKEEFIDRINNITKRYPYLVIEKDGMVEGYAYAGVFKDRKAYDYSFEATIYIDHNLERCGLGKILYLKLEEELKKIGIINLYACIGLPIKEDEYLTNNSRDFHLHLGYKVVGEFHKCGYKFDRWYNMIWMEKMIGEHK
jgi:phosphinothricin acetyltransferase